MSKCIDIVIVNWNAGQQLSDTLASVAAYHSELVASVTIVDNDSTDGSLALVVNHMATYPFKLNIIENQENRGFGAACNQGSARSCSEFLLFLNPDARIFSSSLSVPITFMKQTGNEAVGICGICLVDELGFASTSAARLPSLKVMIGEVLGIARLFPGVFPTHLLTSRDLPTSCVVDQVIGAFFLIRRSVFDLCGGFDERFFVYFEEVDLSIRARKLGYVSHYLAEASAFHRGGGCSNQVKAARLFYSLRSRILYAQKHYSRLEYTALVLLTAFELPLRLTRGLMKSSWSEISNTFSAFTQLVTYFSRRA